MSLSFPSVDQAIADFEGFTKVGSVSANANNPGDIVAGPFATAHGATGSITTPSGTPIAVFPTADQGWSAEDALVSQYAAKGATLQDLITAWAPPSAPGNSVIKSLASCCKRSF